MSLRERVFVVVVTATTDDADFSNPGDLSEFATVMTGALAQGVTAVRDLTLYTITPDDGPTSDVWLDIQRESQHQLSVLTRDGTRDDDPGLIATIAATVDGARSSHQQAMARDHTPDGSDLLEVLRAYKTVVAAAHRLQRLLDTSRLSPALAQRIRTDCSLLQRWREDLAHALNVPI